MHIIAFEITWDMILLHTIISVTDDRAHSNFQGKRYYGYTFFSSIKINVLISKFYFQIFKIVLLLFLLFKYMDAVMNIVLAL